MTRINVIDPTLLTDQHLLAEFREITRVPNTINSGKAKLTGNYPKEYTLGKGHVSFFYPRLKFLHKRYDQLFNECIRRGFNVTYIFPKTVPERLYNDYTPTNEAIKINVERVLTRFPTKAKMNRMNIELDSYIEIIGVL